MPIWVPWFFFAIACVVAFMMWDEAVYNRELWFKALRDNQELWASKMEVIKQLDGRAAKLKRVRREKQQKRRKKNKVRVSPS